MKPETQQAPAGFSLIVEAFITSGHRKHVSGTFSKLRIFFFYAHHNWPLGHSCSAVTQPEIPKSPFLCRFPGPSFPSAPSSLV